VNPPPGRASRDGTGAAQPRFLLPGSVPVRGRGGVPAQRPGLSPCLCPLQMKTGGVGVWLHVISEALPSGRKSLNRRAALLVGHWARPAPAPRRGFAENHTARNPVSGDGLASRADAEVRRAFSWELECGFGWVKAASPTKRWSALILRASAREDSISVSRAMQVLLGGLASHLAPASGLLPRPPTLRSLFLTG
jgi:hypothetical protein